MSTRKQIIESIEKSRIVAVVRLKAPEKAAAMTEALLRGGVSAVEITLTSDRAIELIHDLSQRFSGDALIGVGSVTDIKSAEAAAEAGAAFVVSPVTRTEIIAVAHRFDRPAIIGAYTPTEILEAWEAGADLVKVFPASSLGPTYFRDIHGPLPHVRLTPTGGIDLENARDFIKAGAICLGVGSSLVRKDYIENNDWSGLTELAARFVSVVNQE